MNNVRKKSSWKRLSAVLLSLAMLLATVPFQTYAAGDTVYVSTSAQLKSALENKAVETIIFNNDIEATEKMKVAAKRNNPQLTIDGNNFKFTERYHKNRDKDNGIYVESTSSHTINTINIQNMEIVGRNGYGTVYVPSGNKGIQLVFNDVIYNGPQLVDNENGSVRLQDSTINIGRYNNGYNGEVAEVNKVTMAGEVNITKQHEQSGSVNDLFKIRHKDSNITIEEGAAVNIVNNHDVNKASSSSKSTFFDSSHRVDFFIGDNAVFSYEGDKDFTEHRFGDVKIGKNVNFNVELSGGLSKHTRGVLFAKDTITVGDDSVINIDIKGDSKGKILYAADKESDSDGEEDEDNSQYSILFGERTEININAATSEKGDDGNEDSDDEKNGYIILGKYNVIFGADSKTTINTGVSKRSAIRAKKGDIIVRDRATIDITTKDNIRTSKSVIFARRGSVDIGEDAEINVNTHGVMKSSLLYAGRKLTVREGAVVDLVAHNNTYDKMNAVLKVRGSSYKPSEIIFDQAASILLYNDNKSGKENSFAANFRNGHLSVDITETGAEYWKSASTTGGPEVLEKPDYVFEHENVKGVADSPKDYKDEYAGFNVSFEATGSPAPINHLEYYFGHTVKKYKKDRVFDDYEVCKWEGVEKYSITFDFNSETYHDGDDVIAGKGTEILEGVKEGTPIDFSEKDPSTDENKYLVELFGENNGDCEFMGWSLNPTPNRIGWEEDILDEDKIMNITEDVTVYAIWRSCKPNVDPFYYNDSSVRGSGHSNSTVEVYVPNVDTYGAIVDNTTRRFLVSVPMGIPVGYRMEVIQIEGNKIPSEPVVVIVGS